ncbi:hypothetical protein NCCP691_32830 [Noviherbaspirillum aridicola]|uniref:Transposase IS66 central domain-containing protein n=1 Tax=Noviherbaspirillum aridicola TaxID=2849687 RepID=A0ABQ4Q998_9BURK|nr:hypothetical protein NCCP691_32830 [Noviherbaspirillum aridicola]
MRGREARNGCGGVRDMAAGLVAVIGFHRRSTLAQWVGACGVHLQPLVDALHAALLAQPVLHADETPVAMLKPGNGKNHRAFL